MTLEEFYIEVGGDYKEVLNRGVKTERIERYLKLFQKEDMLKQLKESIEASRYEEAFECSHNLKGLCMNLGLGDLQKASSVICEELRNGKPEASLQPMLDEVKMAYDKVIKAADRLLQD